MRCGDFCRDEEQHENHHSLYDVQTPSSSLTTLPQKRRRLPSTTGALHNLVLLIRFSDHTTRPLPTSSDVHVLFNAIGGDALLAPSGSIRDVFYQNSAGALTVSSTIIDWIDLPYTESYYADGNSGRGRKVHEAIRYALDVVNNDRGTSGFDWSTFDEDYDGYIDAITILHSGYGAEYGGTDCYGTTVSDRIWSHKWKLLDGGWTTSGGAPIRVSDYHINNGVWGSCGGTMTRIGVIAHELGHFLGLPDLYDTKKPGNGIGSFGLMANSWGFDYSQYHPSMMSAWSRLRLGWAVPHVIDGSGGNKVYTVTAHEDIYKITHGYPSGEYLLIENRQPLHFDRSMPHGGLVIYHIDELALDDETEGHPYQPDWPQNGRHYRVALLPADGKYELERGRDRGDSKDVFHALEVNRIGPSEGDSNGPHPNTDAYQGGRVYKTGIVIDKISLSGMIMSFEFRLEVEPSQIPSWSPTISEEPTVGPSAIPTMHPIDIPSVIPSRHPTEHPSDNPTDDPTMTPSDEPSNNPSTTPSIHPTTIPTSSSSNYPSNNPSLTPSSLPTLRPSSSPTPRPSSLPTLAPTTLPSLQPTTSLLPTRAPTYDMTFTTTPFTADNGQAGNFFTIKSKNHDLIVTSFDIHTRRRGDVMVIISYRHGFFSEGGHGDSYRTTTTSSGRIDGNDEWRIICQTIVKGQGEGRVTVVPMTSVRSVFLERGGIMSFHVTLTTPDLRYTSMRQYRLNTAGSSSLHSTTDGSPLSSSSRIHHHALFENNDFIYFDNSIGASYPPTQFFPSRIWNGIIHYHAGTLPPTIQPSLSPTVPPTVTPSDHPSGDPSVGPTVTMMPSGHPSDVPTKVRSEAPSGVPSMSERVRLFLGGELEVRLEEDGSGCGYEVVKRVLEREVGLSVEQVVMGGEGARDDDDDWVVFFERLCSLAVREADAINFHDLTGKHDQFQKNYFDGGTSWNNAATEITSSSSSFVDTGSDIFNHYAHKSIISWPDQIDNFGKCELRTVMCCFMEKKGNKGNGNGESPTIGNDFRNRSSLCYHDMGKSKRSNHLNKGFINFNPERSHAYCNGFSWSSNNNDASSRYKANTLLYISMLNGTMTNGHVKNVPGAPLCGCIEQMPVVTHSDCTKTTVKEAYTMMYNTTAKTLRIILKKQNILHETCADDDNDSSSNNNSLVAYYDKLVKNGHATPDEYIKLSHNHIVNDCPRFKETVFNNHFYIPLKPSSSSSSLPLLSSPSPHDHTDLLTIDPQSWTHIVGSGRYYHPPIGETTFRHLLLSSPHRIIRRYCPHCTPSSHRDIFYKRLTPLPPPADVDFLDGFMNAWFRHPHNEIHVDFELYSTYNDAVAGVNEWNFCNYDGGMGVGFPRECGPKGLVKNNWNSYLRVGHSGRGRRSFVRDHAFYVERKKVIEGESSVLVKMVANVVKKMRIRMKKTKTTGI